MNRRRLSCPLTTEDEAVWIRALDKTYMPSFVWNWYSNADRRDADLMLYAQGNRIALGTHHDVLWIQFRGLPDGWRLLVETALR